MGAVLDQAQLQIARERQAAPPADPWRLLPELLRNALTSLALALGFAALARRPGSARSLLQEWQGGGDLGRLAMAPGAAPGRAPRRHVR